MDTHTSLENNQSLNSIADFFARVTSFSEGNVSPQEEKSNVSSRLRMISLRDSAGIRYKDVYDVAPVEFSHC